MGRVVSSTFSSAASLVYFRKVNKALRLPLFPDHGVKLTRQSECSLHNVRNESVFAPEVRLLIFDQIGTEDQDFILRQDKGKLKLELRRLGIAAPRLMKEEVPAAGDRR
ncbi:hypothetical protein VNO77_49282 [Canavalia gladiata]|uniref:Uncharacterized protein n=1 Tax=Canavalia gladiata TaxID=3824 RepID=A0AAN9PFU6_CANGL